MSTKTELAKLQPQAPKFEPGVGGIPEIPKEDVLAALGMASHHIPRSTVGVQLVLAKYTDDQLAIKTLEKSLPRMIWLLWYDYGFTGNIRPQVTKDIARIAIADFCEPAKFRNTKGEHVAAIFARMSNMDYRTWLRKYDRLYGILLSKLSEQEGPVFRLVYHYLLEPT